MYADWFEWAIERKGIQDRSPVVHLDAIGSKVQTMWQSHAYHWQRSQSLLLTQLHVTAGKVSTGWNRHFPRRSRCGRIDLPSVSRRNFTLEHCNGAGDLVSRITNGLVRRCELIHYQTRSAIARATSLVSIGLVWCQDIFETISSRDKSLPLPLLLCLRINCDLTTKRHLHYQICMRVIAEYVRETNLSKEVFYESIDDVSPSIVFSVIEIVVCQPTYPKST